MQKNSSKRKLLPNRLLTGLVKSRIGDLRSLVIIWNNEYPVDYWWRKHYNVPFGSQQHKQMSFLYMTFDYVEFVEYRLIEIQQILESKRVADIQNNELFTQNPPSGGKQIVAMTKRETDEEYENLDLSLFNDK